LDLLHRSGVNEQKVARSNPHLMLTGDEKADTSLLNHEHVPGGALRYMRGALKTMPVHVEVTEAHLAEPPGSHASAEALRIRYLDPRCSCSVLRTSAR
jgi:hypothetical protein